LHGIPYLHSRRLAAGVSPVQPPRSKNELGQYFTRRNIADLMVNMIRSPQDGAILEPSSGAGVFLDALHDSGYTNATGVEIDQRLASHEYVPVVNQSFVTYNPKERFSCVIGNPPYIRWRDLSEAAREEMRQHKLFGELFNSLSDYLTVFIASSIEMLEDGGELIFITPSFWMHTQHSAPLREWMLRQGSIDLVVDFGEASVFEKVSSAIIIFRYVKGRKNGETSLFRYKGPRTVTSKPISLDSPLFDLITISGFENGSHWSLSSLEELKMSDALEADCARPTDHLFPEGEFSKLGDYVDIANGLVSGLDKAFRVPGNLQAALTSKEQDTILHAIKALGMKPYASQTVVEYIDIPVGLSEDEVKKDYPHFYEHLNEWREKLEARYSYQKELPFWEWAFRRSEKFHLSSTKKGFIPCKERITNKPIARFSLAPVGAAATQDVTAFAPKEGVRELIEYIVAYLCHPSVTDWFCNRGLIKGGIAEFSERPLSSIPFRAIDWSNPDEVRIHDDVVALMEKLECCQDSERLELIEQVEEKVGSLLPLAHHEYAA